MARYDEGKLASEIDGAVDVCCYEYFFIHPVNGETSVRCGRAPTPRNGSGLDVNVPQGTSRFVHVPWENISHVETLYQPRRYRA